jgi:aryl-alcohol dehydrogenase-like predicted oxidoreductase
MTSALVLGTMTFGAQVDRQAAAEMIGLAAGAGVTRIDTANVYAGGASEEIVGDLLKHRRDSFEVATKAGMPGPDVPDGAAPLSAKALRSCLEASLRRLGMDHVDLYYLHKPDRATSIAETLGVLGEFVAEGKVRQIGVSNYAAWQIADLRSLAAVNGWPQPVVAQQLYNVLSRRIEDEYTEFATTHSVATVVYNPLAGGLLTGKHQPGNPGNAGRFGHGTPMGAMYRDRYWSAEVFEAVGELSEAAAGYGLTMVHLALQWLLSQSVVNGVILGASRVEQLRDNLAAATGEPLPEPLLELCDRVWGRLRGSAPAYNR